ncbi:hypothetical protein SAMN05428960_0316 [Mitsuaria sp. PDC51]|uniref:TRAFAC clade GTPase domain-containing protein n=1 Tax=Mitsuaria sp. PDC51 TaxID=1881035 RepID=UPI0008E58177|nr:hypothetical protein [Mitsuaria sp. PDC51]SFR71067.1 hypothetical protein SAMN05428960_0316 [Mitsuaria sp. PDC51]
MPLYQEPGPQQCANPECSVPRGGRCIEGFEDLKGCPHYGKSALIVEAVKPEVAVAVHRGVQLPGAEALYTAAAQALMRQRPTSLIAIVGPHKSGKTSLIGGIYDLLQRGMVGEYAFAGSSTLHAFERACHDSRLASNRDRPHQERTQTGDATYFHLDLVRTTCRTKRAALFANRAGEDYMETHSDPDLARSFPELRKADTLTLLADGEKLLDAGERHQVMNEIRDSLRAFFEAGQMSDWQRLALVLTKVDAVPADTEEGAAAREFFDSIVAEVRELHGARFSAIESFPVAASPRGAAAPRGEGLAKLLAYWMAAPPRPVTAVAEVAVVAERSFGRLRPLVVGGAHEA